MRIDLNAAALSQLSTDQTSNQLKGTGTRNSHILDPTPVKGETQDTATLSPAALALSALTSTALKSPEIRQDKVDAISQALHSGQYEVNPSKIADAILSDRVR